MQSHEGTAVSRLDFMRILKRYTHTHTHTHEHTRVGILSSLCHHAARHFYTIVYKNYVNQLTVDEPTTGYYQQDGATCHISNASMREIESFFKTELSQKIFGHPDLPI